MYVASLGASKKKCLGVLQRAEALRLCNCERYGWPEAPVSGFGANPRSDVDISITLTSSGESQPCNPKLRVQMPSDFDPRDPCEAASRLTCIQEAAQEQEKKRLLRAQEADKAAEEQAEAYEQAVVQRETLKQRLLVGGLVAAVLVGGGFLVYRSTKG